MTTLCPTHTWPLDDNGRCKARDLGWTVAKVTYPIVALPFGTPLASNTVSALGPQPFAVPMSQPLAQLSESEAHEAGRRLRQTHEARVNQEVQLASDLYTGLAPIPPEDCLESARLFFACADVYRARRMRDLLVAAVSAPEGTEGGKVESAEVVPFRRGEKVGVDG